MFSTGQITVTSQISYALTGKSDAKPWINGGNISDTSEFMPQLSGGQIALPNADGKYTTNLGSWSMNISQNIKMSHWSKLTDRGDILRHEQSHVRSSYVMAGEMQKFVTKLSGLNKELSTIGDPKIRASKEQAYLGWARYTATRILENWMKQTNSLHDGSMNLTTPKRGWGYD